MIADVTLKVFELLVNRVDVILKFGLGVHSAAADFADKATDIEVDCLGVTL